MDQSFMCAQLRDRREERPISYSGTANTHNPAAAQSVQAAINANARAESAQVATETQAQMAQLNNVLRTTTLHPGQMMGGMVEVSGNGMAGFLNVHVNIGDEEHVFAFQVSP
jgi:hypothetical protein